MASVDLVEARPHERAQAAFLASSAMIDLPEVQAVFRGQRTRMEAVFRLTFSANPGRILLAKQVNEMVGVMRVIAWPECKPTPAQILRTLPAMLVALKGTLPRGARLQGTWARHDPQKPHLHLDPLAVKPGLQGQGIGSQMLAAYCKRLDEEATAGYLETGTLSNARLYERFGFDVIETVPVFGVPTYMMWREPSR